MYRWLNPRGNFNFRTIFKKVHEIYIPKKKSVQFVPHVPHVQLKTQNVSTNLNKKLIQSLNQWASTFSILGWRTGILHTFLKMGRKWKYLLRFSHHYKLQNKIKWRNNQHLNLNLVRLKKCWVKLCFASLNVFYQQNYVFNLEVACMHSPTYLDYGC